MKGFTVDFLLFLAPAGSSNPAGHSLTLTSPKITPHPYMSKYEETGNFVFFPWPENYIFMSKNSAAAKNLRICLIKKNM